MERVDLRQLFQQEVASALSVPTEGVLTAHEAVRQCLPEIRKSRKRKLSWDRISDVVKVAVQQGYGIDINLTGNTVRNYYYELTQKKSKRHRVSPRRSAQQTQKAKVQPPATVVPSPPEERRKVEPIEVPAPVEEEVVQAELSPKGQQDESTEETVVSGPKQADEPSQADPYGRPPGSRFTRGHKVKYWNGGTS
ncbi:MAG: hypothetical protein AAFY20_25635 [Cyanobacteria bacterium J06639_14]